MSKPLQLCLDRHVLLANRIRLTIRFYISSSDTVVGFYNGSINPTPTLGNSLTFLTGAKVAVGFDQVGQYVIDMRWWWDRNPPYDMDTIATTGASVGFSTGGASEQMYGYYRRLTAWNSKLADATLQALTAP